MSETEIDESLQFLIDNKLIIHLSKCFMALAFVAESTEMLENKDSPSGNIDFDKMSLQSNNIENKEFLA